MKILFCTDGSEASFYAIQKTLPLLHKNDKIDIINIIDWGFLPTYVTFPREEEIGYPDEKNAAQKILDKAISLVESQNFTVNKADYTQGQPANTLLEIIKTEDYNLVILGSHGKKGIKKWLGSVSRKVVTKSSVPTLIVKPSEEEILINKKDILAAVDGSEYSYNAIRNAIDLLNLEGGSVEILTIMPGSESLPLEITMDDEWLQKTLKKQKELANEILEKAKQIFQEHGIFVKATLFIEGDPAETILNYTNENKKDLIIMGSHGREGVSDFLLGSVSKRVLDNSLSPVLIVPIKRKSIH